MSAYDLNRALQARIYTRLGVDLSLDDCATLRRAELTLHRWHELECGDSDNCKSWSIERDETTGKPYMCIYPHTGESYCNPTPDREAGAMRRVQEVCKRNGLHYYQQTDPRGCALYVSTEGVTHDNYTNGVPCAVYWRID